MRCRVAAACWFEWTASREWTFFNLGDSLNHFVMQTGPGGPFDADFALVSTADATTEARVRATLVASGYPESTINVDVISGDDRAYFYDSTGDDTFWSRDGTAALFDTALSLFHNRVTGFESLSDKIVIDGTLGGSNALDVVGIDYILQNNGGF